LILKRGKRLSKQDKEDLYTTHFETVYKTALFLVRDHWAAEDITHDTFNIAFAKYYQLRDAAKTVPWLRTITLNVARSYLKRNNKVTPIDIGKSSLAQIQSSSTPVEDIIEEQETGQVVREAIVALPLGFQEVAILRYYDELEIAEIAELLNIPPGTVKSRLSRARKRIRTHIGKTESSGGKGGITGAK
jgi:RNA polymerase sigma-70 factor (ECF subfamily)